MTIVFVHGAGGGAWEWAIWRRVFAAHGYATAAIELEPCAAGLARTQLADYVAQVHAFGHRAFARSDVTGAGSRDTSRVLVGASLGGLLALACADALSVDVLVLVNPIPPAPFHARLPRRASRGSVIPWGRDATLDGTRRAMPDADAAACEYAWRRWRDESGAVLDAACAGVRVAPPRCAMRIVASARDRDVRCDVTAELAAHYGAELVVAGDASHVGPLLGRSANATARETVGWLSRPARTRTA